MAQWAAMRFEAEALGGGLFRVLLTEDAAADETQYTVTRTTMLEIQRAVGEALADDAEVTL